jgi:hypothetical protein
VTLALKPTKPVTKTPRIPKKQCEANAQQKYDQAKSAAGHDAGKGFLRNLAITETAAAVSGCAVGEIAGEVLPNLFEELGGILFSWPAGKVGWAVGALDAAANAFAPTVVMGALVSGASYGLDVADAQKTFDQEMKACQQIP